MTRNRLIHLTTTLIVALWAVLMLAAIIPWQISMPRVVIGFQSSVVTPRLIPQIWVSALLAVSAVHLLVVLLLPRSDEAQAEVEPWPREGLARSLAGMAIVGSYILFAIPVLGFYASTAAYLVLGFSLLGQRRWVTIVLVAVAVPLILYLFFHGLMNVNPPQGLLF